jgi:chromosome partitioning protein
MIMRIIGFSITRAVSEKTSLVYHMAWMLSEMGVSIAADLDPQANLSSVFLPDERLRRYGRTTGGQARSMAPSPL